jgi:hypothetical protein
MTKKILVILAIALIALCCAASAAPYRDYDMKYSNPNDQIGESAVSGTLNVQLLCFHNLISKNVVIQRIDENATKEVSTLEGSRAITKYDAERYTPLGENVTVELSPTGAYDTRLVEGVFLLTLRDGNSGDPEYAVARIHAGYGTQVNFLGHAVTPASSEIKDLTVTKATYGMVVTIPGTDPVYRTVHHPAVPTMPAWTEHFGDYTKRGNQYDYVGHKNGDYTRTWQYGHYIYTYVAPVHHPAVPGTPAWDEQVLVTPGTPETTTGSYIDVTGIVQGLVSNGELHIAADYPHLHYNALFGDPCPGHVKTLEVKYVLNGAAGTKTVSETEDLNIA